LLKPLHSLLVQQTDLFGETALPRGLSYATDFIDAAEERGLLEHITRLPLTEAQYKQYTAKRRTLSYGAQYDFDSNTLSRTESVPPFLFPLRNRVANWVDIPAERFSHALITEYRPGTALGWHRDVPDFEVVVGISLAGPCRMRFRPYPAAAGKPARSFGLNLERRSAYVMRHEVRWQWQHAISPTKTLRYSITFRTLRAGTLSNKP
jgi:alkylated DNA repair dioxygenase AlkB